MKVFFSGDTTLIVLSVIILFPLGDFFKNCRTNDKLEESGEEFYGVKLSIDLHFHLEDHRRDKIIGFITEFYRYFY